MDPTQPIYQAFGQTPQAPPSGVDGIYGAFGQPSPEVKKPEDALYEAFGQTPPSQMILPDKEQVTQPFGNYNPAIEKYSNGINTGTDFGAGVGTPVQVPSGEWEVAELSNNGDFNKGYGNSVLVKNKKTGEKLRFSHLSQTENLQPGQTFEGGKIGQTGETGNVTGPHLDLEYYDAAGRLADVLKSPYAQYIAIQD